MKRKCATVSVEVRKSQHKYIIGPKGAGIAEILQESGVSVEMPPTDSDKETITLRVRNFFSQVVCCFLSSIVFMIITLKSLYTRVLKRNWA